MRPPLAPSQAVAREPRPPQLHRVSFDGGLFDLPARPQHYVDEPEKRKPVIEWKVRESFEERLEADLLRIRERVRVEKLQKEQETRQNLDRLKLEKGFNLNLEGRDHKTRPSPREKQPATADANLDPVIVERFRRENLARFLPDIHGNGGPEVCCGDGDTLSALVGGGNAVGVPRRAASKDADTGQLKCPSSPPVRERRAASIDAVWKPPSTQVVVQSTAAPEGCPPQTGRAASKVQSPPGAPWTPHSPCGCRSSSSDTGIARGKLPFRPAPAAAVHSPADGSCGRGRGERTCVALEGSRGGSVDSTDTGLERTTVTAQRIRRSSTNAITASAQRMPTPQHVAPIGDCHASSFCSREAAVVSFCPRSHQPSENLGGDGCSQWEEKTVEIKVNNGDLVLLRPSGERCDVPLPRGWYDEHNRTHMSNRWDAAPEGRCAVSSSNVEQQYSGEIRESQASPCLSPEAEVTTIRPKQCQSLAAQAQVEMMRATLPSPCPSAGNGNGTILTTQSWMLSSPDACREASSRTLTPPCSHPEDEVRRTADTAVDQDDQPTLRPSVEDVPPDALASHLDSGEIRAILAQLRAVKTPDDMTHQVLLDAIAADGSATRALTRPPSSATSSSNPQDDDEEYCAIMARISRLSGPKRSELVRMLERAEGRLPTGPANP